MKNNNDVVGVSGGWGTAAHALPVLALLLAVAHPVAGWTQAADPATPPPLIQQDDLLKVSAHVYVILDDDVGFVPNVGIVVGERATLVIDPGLGLPNGEIVLGETRKVSTNEELYVTSTHYHSEHDLGAGAFPASAVMIRSRAEQQDLDEFRMSHAERFARMSPTMAKLLEGAYFRPADIFFEHEYDLDLGGVTVRFMAVGPAHTRGDTVFYVEEDGVLFAGDVVMRRYPRLASPTSGVAVWLEALERLADLDMNVIVPSHGPLGDRSTFVQNREFFETIQSRVGELKAQGEPEQAIADLLTTELAPRFSDWDSEGVERIATVAERAYAEAE